MSRDQAFDQRPAGKPGLPATKGDAARAERVKAALKANIGRRKAQAQARDASEGDGDD
jgi:hypothetical protein